QIERLKSLLAAESGNFASTVQALEERHRVTQDTLTKELSLTRQTLAGMIQQYAAVKHTFVKAESQLTLLRQRDATNRLVLSRLVDQLAKLSSEKQILFDRLGELESRLTWSTSTVPSATSTEFAFNEPNPKSVETSDRELDIASLNERISQLEHRIEQLRRTSESLKSSSLAPEAHTPSNNLLQISPVTNVPDPLPTSSPNPIPIQVAHLRTIDSSETSTPEPPSPHIHENVMCNGSLGVKDSKRNNILDSHSCDISHAPEILLPKHNLIATGDTPGITRHSAVRRSNRVLLTGLSQTHTPRFYRFEIHRSLEPVTDLTIPVICRHPATLCTQSVSSAGMHEVAYVQPKIIKHRRYERDVPGSRAPCSTFESDDQTSDSSAHNVNVTEHSRENSPEILNTKVTDGIPEPIPPSPVITTATHPRLSKLGSVLKSMKRGKTD
ncbi:hypothetical protein FGIG_08790, partial [Fasciola gigantica]